MNAEIKLKIVAGLVASLILLALCYAAYLSGPIGRRNAVFFFGVLAVLVFLEWRKSRHSVNPGQALWVWRDGDEFLVFKHEFPSYPDGDPMTAGEPVGRARFVASLPK